MTLGGKPARHPLFCALALVLGCAFALQTFAQQKADADYAAKIKEYTTEKFFLTELVDHLPASDARALARQGARLRRRHAGQAHAHERPPSLLQGA